MSFDPDEVQSIVRTTVEEVSKKWIGTPLKNGQFEEVIRGLKDQVKEVLDKFSYLGGFEVDPNDIAVTFDPVHHRFNIMLTGETAKRFVGEAPVAQR